MSSLRALAVTAGLLGAFQAHAQPPPKPCANSNIITSTLYFMSKPQDAAQCAMTVGNDGRISFPAALSNPAMSCPDMFSWKLFATVVTQQFWKGWAADQQTWSGVQCAPGDTKCQPFSPLPLCGTAGAAPGHCCDPKSLNNPGYKDTDGLPAKYCPYFPGDHLSSSVKPPLRVGQPPSKAHLLNFSSSPEARRMLQNERQLLASDPGRKIRQSMAELVFRNKPMFDFVFQNNLYNRQGVGAVFRRNNNNITLESLPYRLQNPPRALTEIDFPVESIMIKSNWVAKERAAELGLKEDPAHPYIKMTINSPVNDNNGTILIPGEHWLVAMHISSKDTPNWVWTTFEHVNNPGRCDYTGCNDSYGYASPDTVGSGQTTNYTQPHFMCDGLLLSDYVFDNGKTYPGGTPSRGLNDVFTRLGIGKSNQATACKEKGLANPDSCMPSIADMGWRSYRLKGSQTNFTDSMGRPTRLGNSVTEGGFVNSSSCISCHARAGTTAMGPVPPALGVFVNTLNEEGYGQSHSGVPVPDWYHHSGQPSALEVLQTDFVWGFLTANALDAPLITEGQQAPPVQLPPSVRERLELPVQ